MILILCGNLNDPKSTSVRESYMRVYYNMTFSFGCCTGIFVKRKVGGTRLCIPRDENDIFSLAVIFAFS